MSTRDETIEKLKTSLDRLNLQIDRLEAKAAEASADAKLKYQDQLSSLRQRREEANSKLDELRSASSDAWADLREGAEKVWQETTQAVSAAAERFR